MMLVDRIKMTGSAIKAIYEKLLTRFGPQHWWPAESRLEIIVGTILTQNTAWANVEKAIANLKAADLLASGAEEEGLQRLVALPAAELAGLIRPAGYHNLKAGRLQNLLGVISREYGNLTNFFHLETGQLRRELLAINGVGPETADCILLYAANRPVFVVDAYTQRIFSRHHLLPAAGNYHQIQEIFTAAFPADPQLFNEYHALIVRLGKDYCRKNNPRCPTCPLEPFLTAKIHSL